MHEPTANMSIKIIIEIITLIPVVIGLNKWSMTSYVTSDHLNDAIITTVIVFNTVTTKVAFNKQM